MKAAAAKLRAAAVFFIAEQGIPLIFFARAPKAFTLLKAFRKIGKKKAAMPVDAMDDAIVTVLKDNGRASASAIGKKVNLSVPAVLDRIRKLTQAGIIEGYTVKISRARTGRKLLAFVLVRLSGNESVQSFRGAAAGFDCVLECHHLAGSYDYLLKTAVSDTSALEHFLTDELKAVKGVAETNTLIVLATQKEEVNA